MNPALKHVDELARALEAACQRLEAASHGMAQDEAERAEAAARDLLKRERALIGALEGELRWQAEQALEGPLERLKDQLTRMCRL